jgi:hypothetical protein
MQRFEFRGPRFSCDLPVQLTVKDSTVTVRCTEISKTGMKLEINQPREVNSLGKVSISHRGQTLEVCVRFAHAGESYAGLDFIYASDVDQKRMAELVESLAVPQSGKLRTI